MLDSRFQLPKLGSHVKVDLCAQTFLRKDLQQAFQAVEMFTGAIYKQITNLIRNAADNYESHNES
jgi:hypothetical protein